MLWTKKHRLVIRNIFVAAARNHMILQPSQAHANFLSWLLTDNTASMGMVLMPVFATKRNQVWIAERTCMNQLSQGNLMIDSMFALLFTDQVDARDSRPMVYTGRLVFSPYLDFSKSVWKKTHIVKDRRTQEAPQLSSREMQIIEG